MGKKRDVCGRFGGKLWSTGIGGRPLGCNYPYECVDGEWTGPVWGSDSDQGDDYEGERDRRRESDGGGRQDASTSARPPENQPARHWTKVRSY